MKCKTAHAVREHHRATGTLSEQQTQEAQTAHAMREHQRVAGLRLPLEVEWTTKMCPPRADERQHGPEAAALYPPDAPALRATGSGENPKRLTVSM